MFIGLVGSAPPATPLGDVAHAAREVRRAIWHPCMGTLAFSLRDPEGDPATGVALQVGDDTTAASDGDGQIAPTEIPCGYPEIASASPGWELDPTHVEVGTGSSRLELTLARRCDGIVRVLDSDGTPMEGGLLREDLSGTFAYPFEVKPTPLKNGSAWMQRRCVENAFQWFQDLSGYPSLNVSAGDLRVVVHASEPVDLVLPTRKDAWVQLMAGGSPAETAILTAEWSMEVIAAGPGRFHLKGRGHNVEAWVYAGEIRAHLNVPLDGQEHLWNLDVAPQLRHVHVVCAPEACPLVVCTGDDCVQSGDGWDCACDPRFSQEIVVYDHPSPDEAGGMYDMGTPAPGQSQISVTWPVPETTVTAHWTGARPCTYSYWRGPAVSTHRPCDSDGSARFGDLTGGDWTLAISHEPD